MSRPERPNVYSAIAPVKRFNLALLLVLAAALLVGLFLGPVPLGPAQIWAALVGQGSSSDMIVVWEIRLPRGVAAAVIGAALAMSGAALQGLLRNPLAEPGMLGVSASAALCAAVALSTGLAALHPFALPLAAIAGALLVTALLSSIAMRIRSVVSLILIGVGISSFAGALMSLLMNLAPNPFSLADMVNWMLGSVANRSFADIALAGPFIAVGCVLMMAGRGGLAALALGEESAAALGLDLKRERLIITLGAGLATGAAVALAGAIGFVGIVAPHIVRPWVRYNPALLLLPSALLGALMLVLADIVVRLVPGPSELKLGVVAALIGAPIFIAIAARQRVRV